MSENKNQETVETTPVSQVQSSVTPEQNQIAVTEIAANSQFRNTIKALIANGAKKINGIRVKNVNTSVKENYVMVSLTLDAKINGYVSEDNGMTYKEGLTNVLFTSNYAISAVFKEIDEYAWMANTLLQNINAYGPLMCGCKVDVLQVRYLAGEEVKNPFSTKEAPVGSVYDHDVIINYVVGIHLSETGQKMSDRLADKLLSF